MAILVKDTGTWEAIPTGMIQGTCSAVHDLGQQEGFGGKLTHKVVIVWELAERRTEGDFKGERFVVSKTFTASLNERANLRKALEAWRGRAFTAEELKGFDLEKLKGANANLNLVEKTSTAGRRFVEIAAITPLYKGQKKLEVEHPDYMPGWIAALLVTEEKAADHPTSADDFDDDIPF